MEHTATNNRQFIYPAMTYLMRHTIMIGDSSSRCGNCGANTVPDDNNTCVACDTSWVYMAASYTVPGESLADMKRNLEETFPRYQFIGIATRSAMSGETHQMLDLRLSLLV